MGLPQLRGYSAEALTGISQVNKMPLQGFLPADTGLSLGEPWGECGLYGGVGGGAVGAKWLVGENVGPVFACFLSF